MKKLLNSRTAMMVGGIIAAGGVLWFLSNRAASAAGRAADSVKTAFNPTSGDNLVNRGVGAVGDALSGGESGSFSFGSWLYDLTHPEYDPNADTGGDTLDYIDYADLPRRRGRVATADGDSIDTTTDMR